MASSVCRTHLFGKEFRRFDNVGIKFRPLALRTGTSTRHLTFGGIRIGLPRGSSAWLTHPQVAMPRAASAVGRQRRLDLGPEVVRVLRAYSGRSAWITSTRDARAAGISDASIAAATSTSAAPSVGTTPAAHVGDVARRSRARGEAADAPATMPMPAITAPSFRTRPRSAAAASRSPGGCRTRASAR